MIHSRTGRWFLVGTVLGFGLHVLVLLGLFWSGPASG